MAPLNRVRKAFRWGIEQQAAWDTVRRILKEAPMLSNPDFQKNFSLATDASNQGISAVLFQRNTEDGIAGMDRNDGETRYIAFHARSLQPAERNYSTTKKEALAVVYGLTKFRHFLLGRRFRCFTDHRALVWIFNQHSNGRVTNTWFDTTMEFYVPVQFSSVPVIQGSILC
ncbi:MAG: hypothetical protein K2Z81_25315, partial [Cyanobacteria bacterium]|nr:hypothetical protein [Cyanobacteriota bacterium]